MASKIRYMYLRDDKGSPIGCLAIQLHRKKGYLEYQLSVLNPVDRFHPLTGKQMPFNREVARRLAVGRLVEEPSSVSMGAKDTMTQISITVMQHLSGLQGIQPSRAVRAAKAWLRSHSQ
jgi:hypothetical protein